MLIAESLDWLPVHKNLIGGQMQGWSETCNELAPRLHHLPLAQECVQKVAFQEILTEPLHTPNPRIPKQRIWTIG